MMEEDQYICVGVCMTDPDSGYCLGCGRPPVAVPTVVVESVPATRTEPLPPAGDPESPAP